MSRVVGLGAGGHAKVVLDILGLDGRWEVEGLLDPNSTLHGSELLGSCVLGGDELLPALVRQGVTHAFIGLGSTGDLGPRRRLYELAHAHGLQMVAAIHPDAIVARSATIGSGATLMAGVVVNAGAVLGENVVVNTGAIVEHDCRIGNHVHIATGAALAGAVAVHDLVHLGLGARVREGVVIGVGAIVGAGAVVVDDVAPGAVVVGVPARPRGGP